MSDADVTGGVDYNETEDNSEDSVLLDDPKYVGTDEIYKNSSYVINEPMLTEPDSDDDTVPGSTLNAEEVREAEELAQKTEEDLAFEVDGSNPGVTWKNDTVHPSEANKSTDLRQDSDDDDDDEEEEQQGESDQNADEPRSPFA